MEKYLCKLNCSYGKASHALKICNIEDLIKIKINICFIVYTKFVNELSII